MRHMPIKAKPSASRIKSLWHKSMRPDHTTAREYSCTLSYALPADVAHAVVQYQVSPATNKSHQLDSLNACNHYHVFQWHRTATSKTDELSKYKTQQTQICYNSDCHASSYMNQHNTCKNVKLKYQCQLMNTQTNTHILTTKVLYQADLWHWHSAHETENHSGSQHYHTQSWHLAELFCKSRKLTVRCCDTHQNTTSHLLGHGWCSDKSRGTMFQNSNQHLNSEPLAHHPSLQRTAIINVAVHKIFKILHRNFF